ncbi:hypothetical protein KY366_04855 [Candidatus Woesearchaeota archaeon]|nr:hypothetical protein [Candidatus Woesearchaeota archaeon]
MLWFKYKWQLIFSHGLCVKILRGGESVKNLTGEIKGYLNAEMDETRARIVLDKIMQMIETLEGIVFSSSTLLYREEKDLIGFSNNVKASVKKMLHRCGQDKKRYNYHAKKLKLKMKELEKHKKHLPKELENKVKGEKDAVGRDERLKAKAVSILEELVNLVRDIEGKIYNSRLEAKAQKRDILNMNKVRETINIRSNFRLGELISRKGGIEAGALKKRIDGLMSSAKKKIKRLNEGGKYAESALYEEGSEIHKMVEYCRMEAKDVCEAISFVILVSGRVKNWLAAMRKKIIDDPKLRKASGEFKKALKRFGDLKEGIFVQVKRLDNEYGMKDVPLNLLNELKNK